MMENKDEIVDEGAIRKATVQYLWKIGNLLSSSSGVSRFYMFNAEKSISDNSNLLPKRAIMSHTYCAHCGSIRSGENCEIRVKKKQSINRHIQRLLKLEKETPWKLNTKHKKKLKKFKQSTNKIVYNCLSCHKKMKKDLHQSDLNVDSESSCKTFVTASSRNESNRAGNATSVNLKKQKESIIANDSSICHTDISIVNQNTSHNSWAKLPQRTTPSAQKQFSSKKKKTLLAEIMKQEQSNNRKRIKLSSFLTSL